MNKKFNIKISSKGALKFSLNGRLDSNSAQDFLNVVMSIAGHSPSSIGDKDKHIPSIILDCQELVYISSAGLRAMLTIKKRTDTLNLINVSPEVYNILEVTGFTQIFNVAQVKENFIMSGIKELDKINGEIIADTGGITIYKTKSDELIKLYPENIKLDDVRNELNHTKIAFISGVPTLISYYVVKIKNRYGLIYEMPSAKTVASMINFQSSNLNSYAKNMGSTLKQIHSCIIQDGILPKTSDLFLDYLKKASAYYNPDEVSQLSDIIRAIPESNKFIYGNYHAGNVFIQNNEILLLNMSGVSVGNPIYDLAKSYMFHVSESEIFAQALMGFDVHRAEIFSHVMLCAYFGSVNITEQEKIINMAADLCSALLPGMGKFPPEQIVKFTAKARKNILANSYEYIETLSQANF